MFSIQYASNFSGVGLHTIRAWERRYNVVTPSRSDNGRRVYNQSQIEKLKALKELTNLGSSISQVAHLSLDELNKILGQNKKSGSQDFHRVDFETCLDRLKAAASFKKLDILTYELSKISKEVSLKDLCIKVVMPFLKYLGDLYEKGEITIAQEHAISSILKFHMGAYIYSPCDNCDSKKTIVLATPEGELHEFGIILGALLAKHYGIKFYFLGANLPSESLNKAVKDLEVNAVILGVTNPVIEKSLLVKYIESHFEKNPGIELWIGGRCGVLKETYESRYLSFLETFEKLDFKLSNL